MHTQRPLIASLDPRLGATLISARDLRYSAGPDPDLDRPDHVRAGSGLCWWQGRLAVAQDDACFVALVDPATGATDAIALPHRDGLRQFDKSRGNKMRKLDLESALVLGDELLLLGSGSADGRDQLICVRETGEVSVFGAAELYDKLRANTDFAGPELNLEGATLLGDAVILLQRGNGAPVRGEPRVNATCALDALALRRWMDGLGPCPAPCQVQRYALGTLDGVRLSFTDADAWNGALYFLAAAEDAPDAVEDGPVTGMVIGRIDANGLCYTPVIDAHGALVAEKGEGLVVESGRAWIVTDADDATTPARLLEVALTGDWTR